MDIELQSYLEAIPSSRRQRVDSIRQLVLKLYPSASESMRNKMPTFEWAEGWIAVAKQKNYVSLYSYSAQHIAAFKLNHPTIKTGQGCINFRDRDMIPLDGSKAVIASALEFRHG